MRAWLLSAVLLPGLAYAQSPAAPYPLTNLTVRGNKRFKLLYATQIDKKSEHAVAPPTFMLFVNYPELLTDDYQRYLEARIRQQNGYYGLPIIFRLRSRHR